MPRKARKDRRLVDATERATAATEFGRTVVVTAGAGTGKTALLVERTLNILMMPAARTRITDILALTFSKRAAGEMRVRIREALTSFLEWSLTPAGPPTSAGHLGAIYRNMLERTGLSREEVRERSVEALSSLERASIGTMHSFAGQILRTHPVEAGVDPRFREDDGLAFDEHFEAAWERFLERELDDPATRAELWNRALDALTLTDLTELARKLCDEQVQLDELAEGTRDGSLFVIDRDWIEGLANETRELLAAHEDGASQNTGRLLAAAAAFFDGLLAGKSLGDMAECKEGLATSAGATKKWDAAAVSRAKGLGDIAEGLLRSGEEQLRDALDLLLPFAREFREGFVRSGEMSFNALLVRARDLLRDHARVRDGFKRRYKHILVDEFQDTDPVQYEIVFYLAEREGSCADEWRDCELEPGKLFIVGDPKQSIYHFRGADIGAYHEVVERRLSREAASLALSTNFRSNSRVIAAVNGIFESVIAERPGIQPRYVALDARPSGEAVLDSQRVDFLLTRPPGGGSFGKAADGHEGEARAVARFIAKDLVGEADIPDGNGGRRRISAGDVAILLRKTTNVGHFTEALESEGVPYAVEGEKSFYTTQEVTDFLNLLTSLTDPDNRTAFVGVLRSGVGALTDVDIARLAEARRLDYTEKGELPASLQDRGGAERLYAAMRELRAAVSHLPVAEVIDEVTRRLPVMEAAIASGSGGRGLANLRKIRRMAVEYGERPEITMREFVSRIRGLAGKLQDEGESPLAEEDADAVRILTIHKAKGLEFPVVVIPGLHAGGSGTEERVWVRSEWSSGVVGLRVGDAKTPTAVRLAARGAELNDAEERRVLYVGTTRARERLVFSAARVSRKSPGAPLSTFTEVTAIPFDSEEPAVVPCGEGEIHYTPLDAPEPAGGPRAVGEREGLPVERLKEWVERWRQRERDFQDAKSRRILVRPSDLAKGKGARLEAETEQAVDAGEARWEGQSVGRQRAPRSRAGAVGSVVHRALELLPFGTKDVGSEVDRLTVLAAERIEPGPGFSREEVAEEARSILRGLVDTDVFAELRGAKVLAKEIACILPWDVDGPGSDDSYRAACSGVIDLVCELDGRLLVVDYKTDRVDAAAARERADDYRPQGEAYARAVTLATGRRVDGFRLLFLRPCIAVDLDIGGTA